MSASLARESSSHLGRVVALCSVAALTAFTTVAHGEPVGTGAAPAAVVQHDNPVNALGLRVGFHGQYRTASAFWQTPTWWSHDLSNGWGRLDLLGEVSATYWDARNGHHSSMWQAGTAALLRWWPSETPFFLEAGFGPTLISQTRFADYGLGTALQFGSHVGVGYVFNKRHQVSLRASHFSNASIKRPNDGLNLIQLDYAVRF